MDSKGRIYCVNMHNKIESVHYMQITKWREAAERKKKQFGMGSLEAREELTSVVQRADIKEINNNKNDVQQNRRCRRHIEQH